jgi:membrane-associated phospholipid phosphatase
MVHDLDLHILLYLNSLLPSGGLWHEIFEDIGNNALIRGFPVFVPLLVLWHSNEKPARRSRMLAGFIAACVATLLSVQLQHHVHTHIRPFLDPAIHLQNVDSTRPWTWDHQDSFPSDTASLFFSLAMVVFIENKLAGTVAFLWSLISVGVFRVALGWHYPSDIAGALILGPACVVLFERSHWLAGRLVRLLLRYQSRPYIVQAGVFLFLADAYWLFQGLQGLYQLFQMSGKNLITKL